MVETPSKSVPRIFLIDAYALIYRSFFAFINRPLTNSKGENTSAPWGFVNFLLRIREDFEPDYLAVVFDSGMSQREELYPDYKATREKMPDELRASLPRIEQILEAFHDPVVKVEGYEADDVIGTLAEQAVAQGLEAVIVSGDKDFYQLIGPRVSLLNPGRGGPTGVAAEWVDTSNASEKFGISPEQVVDYLALIGDSSDNVPGAPGIGPKTAVKLLEEYGSLDEILTAAPGMKAKRARESLTNEADLVRLSRQLVTIMKDVPIELDLEALQVHRADQRKLIEVLAALEFRSLIERLDLGAPEGAEAGASADATYTLVTDPGEVAELVGRIRSAGEVSVDTETTSTDPMRATLVGISLSLEPGEAFYLPLAHRSPSAPSLLDESPSDEPVNLPGIHDPAMGPLKEVLEDPRVRKIGQNLKYDLLVFKRSGVDLRGLDFDTMVASYVLDPGRRQHSLDVLALDLLGHRMIPYSEVAGKGNKQISFAEVGLDAATEYAAEDADYALRLQRRFQPEMEEHGLLGLFRELEMPLVPVLARLEWNGIAIDAAFFKEMSHRLAGELASLRERIHEAAGGEFNINSTQQLREILFDRLELPVIKRTKTGPSTDASVLEELAALGHQLPALMMEYRQLEKLRSTYVDSLPELVHPETGRIHTSFNQTVAATGRLSSSDPNLQNIPIRTELGREIRRGFVAPPGHLFVSADYSQIELRILAHFSQDPAFLTAFREGIDVHRQTAAIIFEVGIEEVTPEMRSRAKTINFGTLYGQGGFSLARQLGIPRDEADRFIEEYFERFAGVRRYLDEQVEGARERGYVETLMGRRRFIPELKSGNWNVRQFGERVAQNTPIQGSAADLIKRATIDLQATLDERFPDSLILLQVHDELLLEVPEAQVEAVSGLVAERMEGALRLDVPLVVDVGVGPDWYNCKG
jgi:DNA polymerase-1